MNKFLLLVCFVALSCEPVPTPVPPEPPVPQQKATCESACSRQRELGCELGEPTPEGSTCEEICRQSLTIPLPDMAWDVEKMTVASSCEE